MMGRQSGQLSMMVMDLSELIPNNHLLRRISQVISFDFIYEILEPYYPSNGRPSIDPISMFKMLLVGYLYGIKSERRLVQEIQLNIAYRWFCGFELADKIPDHSTFSKTRLRKWNESQLFQQVFLEIVRRCVKGGCACASSIFWYPPLCRILYTAICGSILHLIILRIR